ncbi:MAG: hypothetical protein LUG27_01500 [Clostridiales bacterium]|nr:hypothetical protein [Clostridiales bacterium]
MKYIDFRKSESAKLIVIMVLCFLIHIAVINQFVGWFSTDTDGYWLHAATFTGHDWSGVAQNLNNFYSWGYSLLLTIPFLVSSDIYVMYKIAVVINVILCCLIIPLAYILGRKIAPDMNRNALLLCAAAVSLYSTYILESAVSLAETLIYFLVFLILWLLFRYLETDRAVWGILSGFAVGYLYIVHNRCVGIVAAYVIIAVLLSLKMRSLKRLLIMILPLAAMLLLNYGVNQWLEAVENTAGVYTRNTYGHMSNKVTNGATLYMVISMAVSALGSCWYMLAGTFLTAGMGLIAIGKQHIFQNKRLTRKKLFYIYSVLSWLFMLAVSVLATYRRFPLETGRTDIYYYGRYMEATIGFFIFMGLIYLWGHRNLIRKTKEAVLCFLVTVFLSLIVYYMTNSYVGTSENYFSVTAILMTFFYPAAEVSVKSTTIVALVSSALIFYLFLWGRKSFRYLSVLLLCAMFVFVGYNASYSVANIYIDEASVTNRPTANADFNDICAYVEENEIDALYVLSSTATEAFSWQMVLNTATVTGLLEESQLTEVEDGGIVLVKKAEQPDMSALQVIYENETYYICLFCQSPE